MRISRILTVLALGLLWLGTHPSVSPATPPQPTYGTAVVDGDPGEWNLTADFFADMYRAGKASKPLESKLYLRYDCYTGTLFALILTEPGVVGYIDTSAVTGWIAIDSQNNKLVNEAAGNDGVPPDFAWIDRGFDADSTHVHGYEASFHLPEGTYAIIGHVDVYDGGAQTSATEGFPGDGADLEIDCGSVPTQPTTWSRMKQLYR